MDICVSRATYYALRHPSNALSLVPELHPLTFLGAVSLGFDGLIRSQAESDEVVIPRSAAQYASRTESRSRCQVRHRPCRVVATPIAGVSLPRAGQSVVRNIRRTRSGR